MNWWKGVFFRRRLYGDLSEEMREHLDERVDELTQEGMSGDDALAAARREFGNRTLLEEHGREVWQWRYVEGFLRDLRLSLRQLRRAPGFSLIVILTLMLAIGANTAVFTMVNALLLRPLPYPEPENLAGAIRHVNGVLPNGRTLDETDDSHDGETWELVRDAVPSALSAAYSSSTGVNMEANHQLRYVQDHRISARFFDVLGIRPVLGRAFSEEEDRPQGPDVVVLSYELWQSIFSGNPQVLGQTIRLKGGPYAVVGVMPPGVPDIMASDLWTPLRPSRTGEGGGANYGIVMRVRARAGWSQVNAQLWSLHPAMFDQMLRGAKALLVAQPLQEDLAMEKRTPTLILMSAVSFVLLIAAANIAGLMLVRLSRRNAEIATRIALGAPRAAIVRQVLMEPLVLTLLGAASGLALAYLCLQSFTRLFSSNHISGPFGSPDLLPLGGLAIDGRVLIFTILCAIGASMFTGAFQVFATNRVRIRSSLSGATSRPAGHGGRLRWVLIASEVCLTLVLLAGAGLLIRTLIYLQQLPSGFDGSNVLTARASLDDSRYHDPAAFQKLVNESLAAMKNIPGVELAAVGLSLPYERGLNNGFKVLDGPTAGKSMASSTAYVTPEYFQALRIPVLAGRAFTDSDTSASEPVVMVNVAFAKQHLGNLDVIGRHIALGETTCTVIGLTGDVKKVPGISQKAPLCTEPMYYVPYTQVSQPYLALVHVWFEPSWIVRSAKRIEGLPAAMQKALAEAAPTLPFSGFYSLGDLQAAALSQQHTEVTLLTALSGLALLLSIVGVYGLVSNLVVQQRREIGIRMALGSTLPRAMRTVVGPGISAAVLGLGAGLILSFLTLRILRSELYGVGSLDPATLVAASLFLFCMTLLASFAATLRVARIDPAATLRAE